MNNRTIESSSSLFINECTCMYIQCKQESIIRIMFSYFVLWALYYVALSSKEECWQNGNSNQLGSFIFPWSWYAMILGKIKLSVSNRSLRTRNFMWKFFVEVPQKLPLLGKTWKHRGRIQKDCGVKRHLLLLLFQQLAAVWSPMKIAV